jgi:hypothetical protein
LHQSLWRNLISIETADVFSIAQHANPVSQGIHFFHAVDDVDNGNTITPQFANYFKQSLSLALKERSRWFIHHQDAAFVLQRPGNFNLLLFRDRQIGNNVVWCETGR